MTNEMSAEAKLAQDIIEKTSANLFLTGKAGTGKTTFLRSLRERSPKRMVVLAPTGIAAINAEGQTIHSFFQLPLSPYIPGTAFNSGDKSRRFKFSKVKRNIIRTLDLIVIDEISMVRSDLLDAIDDVMRRYREREKPFGGVQLLMIGDLHQLAPVTVGDEENILSRYYDTPYFFSSKQLQKAGYLTVELTKVYRQQDDRFVSLLNEIRNNTATASTLAELNKRYIPNFKPSKEDNYIRLTTHNRPAQMINEQELELIDSTLYTFDATVTGTFPETSYPADFTLKLKAGAQIMFIRNDANHRYYNGMIGEIVSIDSDGITVRSRDTGEEFTLDPAEWTNSKYTLNESTKEIEETVEGTFRQYPVRLAWAITIHKSQGLTFEHAIIDASHSFTHGQTYVALSRCKSLEGMVLSEPLSQGAIIKDDIVDAFTNSMQQPDEETVSEMERRFTVQCVDELFNFIPMHDKYDLLVRTMIEYFSSKCPKLIDEYRQTDVVFKSLISVAQTFHQQYMRMLYATNDIKDCAIQERIRKGAEYFADKNSIIRSLVSLTNIKSDNKNAMTLFTDRFQALREETEVKAKLFTYYAHGGAFTVSDYLRRKARYLLGENDNEESAPKKTAAEKPKKTKSEKGATRKLTLEMYKRGMKASEIAHERNLAQSTVMGHLAQLVVDGEIGIRDFVSTAHENNLREFIAANPDMTFSEIRTALGESYNYNEISIVKKLMDREE